MQIISRFGCCLYWAFSIYSIIFSNKLKKILEKGKINHKIKEDGSARVVNRQNTSAITHFYHSGIRIKLYNTTTIFVEVLGCFTWLNFCLFGWLGFVSLRKSNDIVFWGGVLSNKKETSSLKVTFHNRLSFSLLYKITFLQSYTGSSRFDYQIWLPDFPFII